MTEVPRTVQPLTWSYPILHWILTVLVAPIFTIVYIGISDEWIGVEWYGFMLIFGGVMSIPCATVYYIVAYFVIGDKISKILAKALLTSVSLLTFMYFDIGLGIDDLAIIVPYLVVNLLFGIVLKK